MEGGRDDRIKGYPHYSQVKSPAQLTAAWRRRSKLSCDQKFARSVLSGQHTILGLKAESPSPPPPSPFKLASLPPRLPAHRHWKTPFVRLENWRTRGWLTAWVWVYQVSRDSPPLRRQQQWGTRSESCNTSVHQTVTEGQTFNQNKNNENTTSQQVKNVGKSSVGEFVKKRETLFRCCELVPFTTWE